jgi:hypothetical protein
MLTEVGIAPEISCSASTPADIQWMVRAGYGVALVDQRTPIDTALTTRPIAGVSWTADTAYIHHNNADHLALPLDSIRARDAKEHVRQEASHRGPGSSHPTGASCVAPRYL